MPSTDAPKSSQPTIETTSGSSSEPSPKSVPYYDVLSKEKLKKLAEQVLAIRELDRQEGFIEGPSLSD